MANLSPRRLLPLLSTPHKGGRSAMTCQFRCGNACAHDSPTPAATRYFGDVAEQALSRRGALRAGALGALVAGAGAGAAPAFADPAGPPRSAGGQGGPAWRHLPSTPVPPNTDDALRVPERLPLVRGGALG